MLLFLVVAHDSYVVVQFDVWERPRPVVNMQWAKDDDRWEKIWNDIAFQFQWNPVHMHWASKAVGLFPLLLYPFRKNTQVHHG